MPEDIDARIVITVESDKAEEASARVKRGIDEIRASREREVRVAEAAAKAELAEYNSNIAAQKAYNAELELQAAIRRKIRAEEKGASSSQLDKLSDNIETARGKYLRLEAAAAKANRVAFEASSSLRDMTSDVGVTATTAMSAATKSSKKLTLGLIAAKTAARAFGLSFRGFAPQMIALSAAAKAGAMWQKVIGEAWGMLVTDRIGAADRERAAMREYNGEILYSRLAERRGNFGSAFSAIERLNATTGPLNEAQRLELSNAMAELNMDFRVLGISVDTATGKFVDAANAVGEIRKKELEDERKALSSRQKELRSVYNQALLKANYGEVYDSNTGEWKPATGEKAKGVNRFFGDMLRVYITGKSAKDYYEEADKAMGEITTKIMPRIKQLDRELAQLPGAIKVYRKKTEIAEKNAAELLQKKAESAATRAVSGIASETFKYRATTQGSVLAGSAEAARLQSRIFTNTVSPNSPAVQTANGVNTLVEQGKQLAQRISSLDTKIGQIAANTGRTASTMSGGRQY